MRFHEVDIATLEFNPFEQIGRQWMLITAGDGKNQYHDCQLGRRGHSVGQTGGNRIYPSPEIHERVCRSK